MSTTTTTPGTKVQYNRGNYARGEIGTVVEVTRVSEKYGPQIRIALEDGYRTCIVSAELCDVVGEAK